MLIRRKILKYKRFDNDTWRPTTHKYENTHLVRYDLLICLDLHISVYFFIPGLFFYVGSVLRLYTTEICSRDLYWTLDVFDFDNLPKVFFYIYNIFQVRSVKILDEIRRFSVIFSKKLWLFCSFLLQKILFAYLIINPLVISNVFMN